LADLEHQAHGAHSTDSSRNLDAIKDPEEGIRAHRFDLLDPEGLDQETLKTICQSYDKTPAINQRIVDLMMAGIEKKVLSCPPPILGRAFQELGMGMFRFHEALKFKDAPFPVPYIVVADMLMLIHSLMTPFVMSKWADSVPGAMFFSFIPCFSLWALHGIAEELDNPFADGQTNLDAQHMTEGFNRRMLSFLGHASVVTSPALSACAQQLPSMVNGERRAPASSSFWTMKAAVMNAHGLGLTMASSIAKAVDNVTDTASRLLPSLPLTHTTHSQSSRGSRSSKGQGSDTPVGKCIRSLSKLHCNESGRSLSAGSVPAGCVPIGTRYKEDALFGADLILADVRIECVEAIAEKIHPTDHKSESFSGVRLQEKRLAESGLQLASERCVAVLDSPSTKAEARKCASQNHDRKVTKALLLI